MMMARSTLQRRGVKMVQPACLRLLPPSSVLRRGHASAAHFRWTKISFSGATVLGVYVDSPSAAYSYSYAYAYAAAALFGSWSRSAQKWTPVNLHETAQGTCTVHIAVTGGSFADVNVRHKEGPTRGDSQSSPILHSRFPETSCGAGALLSPVEIHRQLGAALRAVQDGRG